MMNDALVQLAERCEAAAGPNFALEREIADAVWRAKWGKRRPKDIAPQPCTASLDAAMTLVPEGRDWMVDNFDGPHDRRCAASVFNAKGQGYVDYEAHAATPALALTAAALRALAKEPTP